MTSVPLWYSLGQPKPFYEKDNLKLSTLRNSEQAVIYVKGNEEDHCSLVFQLEREPAFLKLVLFDLLPPYGVSRQIKLHLTLKTNRGVYALEYIKLVP